MAKKPRKQWVTPVGVASFPYLREPDTEGQYADDKWKVTLVFDDDVAPVLEEIEEVCRTLAEQAFPDADLSDLKLPFRSPEEQTREELDGKYTLTTKTAYKPDLVDTKKNDLPADVEIQGSDLLRCVVLLLPYETTERIKVGKKTETITAYGVSAQLQLVQLVEKRAGKSARGALDDIDGYSANDADTSALDDEEY